MVKGSMGGTALKNAIVNMASPTKEMQKVMDKYGLSLTDSEGKMKSLKGVMDQLREKMGGLSETEKAEAASHLFGKEAMSGLLAVINASQADYDKLTTAIYGSQGAAKKMADTKLDSLSGQWTILKSAVEGMNITLGEKLAPYAKQFVTWFTGKIPDITNGIVGIVDTISKHTDDIKGIAVAIGSVITAIAGLNVAGSIGNSISGVANLVSLFKGVGVAGEATKVASSFSAMGLAAKALPLIFSPAGAAIAATIAATAVGVHEYNKLMDESILTAKEDLDPIERFFDSINGNKHKTKQELQDLGLVYSDFGNDVSESFKTAAKDASKNLLEIEMNINRLGRNGGITSDNNNAFRTYINDFTYAGINEMKSKQDEIRTELTKAFNLDGVISESEQGSLDGLSRFYEDGVNKQLEIRDEIYKIGDTAIKDHGAILDSDMEQIKEKLAEIQSLKLEYANAESAGEAAYASSKFQREADKVTGLEGASELLQSRAKDRDSAVEKVHENYDKSIGSLEYMKGKTTNETDKANFDKQISELEDAREKAITSAMESYKSDLETFYESNGEYKGKINEKTGDIFSKKEIESQGVMEKQESMHDMSNITESGVYALKNSVTGKLDELYVNVDEDSKKIMGVYNATLDKTGAYSDQEKENLSAMKDSYSAVGQEIDYLTQCNARLNTSTGDLVTAGGSVIQTLSDVTAAGDGLVTGIMQINDTPYQITCDTTGTIMSIQAVTDTANSVPNETEANIDTNADETASKISSVTGEASLIPANTPANVSTNADSATSSFDSLYSSIMSIPAVKTVTVTVKKVFESVSDFFTGGSSEEVGQHHASGTEYATAGLSTVNEQGWELSDRTLPILGTYKGNPVANLQKGTKIKSHMNSVDEMKADIKKEVAKQTPQLIQVYQPQLAMQGENGGNSFNFNGVNININDNQSIEAMVQDGMIQFGKFLKEALSGIKS